jgi:hypothetical protein
MAREENDFYPTPPEVMEALLTHERFVGTILEPSCGEGDISIVFLNKGKQVHSNDLIERNFGMGCTDFLEYEGRTYENIITNPPYKHSMKFIIKAKEFATRKIAMLLPLTFLESQQRYDMFQDKEFALKAVYSFSERITLYKPGSDTKGSGKVAYAWFVWDKEHIGSPVIKWIEPKTRFVIVEKHVKSLRKLRLKI